jgi:hypothetical protein
MSSPLRTAFAAAALASLMGAATGQEAPTSAQTRQSDHTLKAKDESAAAKREPAPMHWDGLSPRVIDGKTRAQQKTRTLPRQMPAEIR